MVINERIRRALAGSLAATLLLLPASLARADRVVLHDGRSFQGEITEQTRDSLTIRARVGSITTTLTFDRSEISQIIEEAESEEPEAEPAVDAPPGDPGSTSSGQRAETIERRPSPALPGGRSTRPIVERTHYVVIPIHGTIGVQAQAEGVRLALDRAFRTKIDHIVFHIDTPGGYLSNAEAMVDHIASFEERASDAGRVTTIYACIDQAISAGIWIVAASDYVFFEPGGAVGGAVIYSQEQSTGAVEVDAKMNSIYAGQLASLAEQHGHDAGVIRAMMLLDAELYAVPAEGGAYDLVRTEPASGTRAYEVLATKDTILTLTAEEAGRYGFGEILDGGPDAIGERLGFEGWSQPADFGDRMMVRARKDFERQRTKDLRKFGDAGDRALEMMDLIENEYPALLDRAAELDPLNFQYDSAGPGGTFSAMSKRDWVRRTDACIDAWRKVLVCVERITEIDDYFIRRTGRSLLEDRDDGTLTVQLITERLRELQRDRGRTSL